MTNAVLAETKQISLDVGEKMLVVGANDSGIAKFLRAGEDRYAFMNVGSAKQARELPGNNFTHVIVNGRIPQDVQDKVQTLADRAKVQAILVTENGGSLLKMMDSFPLGNKGLLTFAVPEVVQTIDLHSPNPVRKTPPPPPPPTPPPPPSVSLGQALGNLEQIYDQFGGDKKKVIAHFRSLDFSAGSITDGALYQRCLTIHRRRENAAGKGKTAGVDIAPDLLVSEKSRELLLAIEAAKTSQEQILVLAAAVAAENQQLRKAVESQAEQLRALPELQAEVADLRKKAEAARQLFGSTQNSQ